MTSSYGKNGNDPIHVIGVEGELNYLEGLSLKLGQPFIYHRLGSKEFNGKRIDMYETVSTDGEIWDILFFDMYSSHMDNKIPEGFKLKNNFEEFHLFISQIKHPNVQALKVDQTFGSNSFVRNFPVDVALAYCKNFDKGYTSDKTIAYFQFERPEEHKTRLNSLNLNLNL